MITRHSLAASALVLVPLLIGAVPVGAQTTAFTDTASENVAQVAPLAGASMVSPTDPVAFASEPIGQQDLKLMTGREDIAMLATSNHTANVSNNNVGDNSRTGEIGIGDSAFQNLSGLSVINVNTGNNVGVNAAINVNIVMNPQP